MGATELHLPTAMPNLLPTAPRPPAALRRYVRERFGATGQVKLADGRVLEARTLDISLGGVQLVLAANLPVHGLCTLRLRIPAIPLGVHTLTAQAQVASIVCSGREGGFVAGLRFTALPAASLAALEAYLQARDAQHARHNRPRTPGAYGGSPASRLRPS
jgi:c-di-GMP-binding flagellar brake protein YcgR